MPKTQCQRGFKMNPSTGICEENKKLQTHTPRVRANVRRRNTRNLRRNTGPGDGVLFEPYCLPSTVNPGYFHPINPGFGGGLTYADCNKGRGLPPNPTSFNQEKLFLPNVSRNVNSSGGRNTRNLRRGNTGTGNAPLEAGPACMGEVWSGCYTPYEEGCNMQMWDSYCNCMKDYYDAIGQSTWWESGTYHCSHSGNDWPPCLSAQQCFNQGWYKNCICLPLDSIGGSGCPSFDCYGCHHPSSEDFVEGFGFQYYYYPSDFVDNCIPPFAWASGGGIEIGPPKGDFRRGGRIRRHRRR